MMKYYIIMVAIVFVIFLYNSIVFRKRELEKLRKKIRENWGTIPQRKYTHEELQKLVYYYQKSIGDNFTIDDITWNDLDMDSIFMMINNTCSSVGEECLYKELRIPKFDEDKLLSDEELYTYFGENKEESFKLQEIFSSLGRTNKISMYEFIDRLKDVKRQGNLQHYIGGFLFICACALLFMKPIIGIAVFFAVLIYNIGSYYQYKAEIENYFICFGYLSNMIICSQEIIKLNVNGIEEYNEILKKSVKSLEKIRKGSFLIAANGTNGSLGEIVMDYVRMIFHVDIIKFNSMLQTMIENTDSINQMFETLGKIEVAMAVASFREALQYYAVPQFESKKGIDADEIFHPLISKPVANSIKERKSVLITGSNASGKSTFLKTIAINLILAQTIHTCTAKKFKACFCKTYTSMALKDNLFENESYFIVEIKSIKRIIDAINQDIPVICFVDEVLRGTNTIERIAASSYILKAVSERNAICFAATHDIELTNILEEDYSNYHFMEEVKKDDVLFNYELNIGRATSRNAIKLLNVIGFDKKIVKKAEIMAEGFISDGVWKLN